MKKQMGFNLIELLVVLAIIGILASVAYPAYTDYLEQGKVQEATAGLAEGRIKFSQYYQDHSGSYIDAENTICPPSTQYFDFTCETTASTYTLTADGKNGMDDFSYSVDQANVRFSSSTLWGTSGACWIMRRGGSC